MALYMKVTDGVVTGYPSARPQFVAYTDPVSGESTMIGTQNLSDDDLFSVAGYAAIDPAFVMPSYSTYVAGGVFDAGSGKVTPNTEKQSIQSIRQKAIDQAANKRQSLLDTGFNYQGNNYQIDDDSLSVMGRFMIGIVAQFPNPHKGYYRSTDNVDVPMDDAELAAFVTLCGVYVGELRAHLHSIKNAILAALDEPAVIAVDIEAGWPDNDA